MRKKYIISVLLLVSLSIGGCAFADTYSDDTSFRGSVSMTNYDIQPRYMQWYDIDRDNFRATFRPLTKDQIKNLSDTDKAQYKKTQKIEKLLAKGDAVSLSKAYQIDNRYIPTILVYFNNAQSDFNNERSTRNVDKVAKWAASLNNADEKGIFPKDKINYDIGRAAWNKDNYTKCLDLLLPISEQYKNDYYYIMVADSYYHIGDFDNAIKYAAKIPKNSNLYYRYFDITANSYYALGNKKIAYKYIKELYNYENPKRFSTAWKIGQVSDNENEKLEFYKKAKQLAGSDVQKLGEVNAKISEIYQKRVTSASKSITGFFEEPDVEQIVNLGFENDLSKALQYRGNDLKAAFMSLNRKVDKTIAKLDANQRAAQQRALDEQRIQAINQQNALQAQQNQLLQQQNQILNKPHYSTTTYTKYGSYTTHY